MSNTQPCLILDVTDIEQWTGHHGGGHKLPMGGLCTVLQPSREVAEREALRLANRFPERRFAIFEATQLAASVQVPSHVTLGGHVFQHRRVAHLVSLGDGVPF